MVDIELILGIAIIVVAVITFIRILKPALEGVVVKFNRKAYGGFIWANNFRCCKHNYCTDL